MRDYLTVLALLVGTTLGVSAGLAVFKTTQEAYATAADAYLQVLEARLEVRALEVRIEDLEAGAGYGI